MPQRAEQQKGPGLVLADREQIFICFAFYTPNAG